MVRNSLYNLLGIIIPTIFFIPATAYLARTLNVESFGVLMLSYAILGYASIFDLGFSRAVIRKVASHADDEKANARTIGTALISVFFISLFAVFLMLIFSGEIANFLNVSDELNESTEYAIKILSLAIPFFLLGVICFSYLEGKQYFLLLNKCKAFTGSLFSIMPVACVYVEPNLLSAVIGILIARFISFIISFQICYKIFRQSIFVFNKEVFVNLVKFGGWITVSNIISPLMANTDKLILSSTLGAEKVAFYSSASDLITKLAVIPAVVSRTIFPIFSSSTNEADIKKVEVKAYFILGLTLFVISFISYFSSEYIFNLWLGEQYGDNSSTIFNVLVFGYFFNGLAQIPAAKIQGLGYAKTTAFIQLVEVVPYFILLYSLMDAYGLIGVAYAWVIRVVSDFFILEYFSRKCKV